MSDVVSSFALDQDNDVMLGTQPDGAETIVPSLGAETVAQAAAFAVSTHRGSLWYNQQIGLEYDGVFINTGRNDDELAHVRATALREVILSIPGVEGFADDSEITFTRQGRTLMPSIPCIIIDCDNSRTRGTIGTL